MLIIRVVDPQVLQSLLFCGILLLDLLDLLVDLLATLGVVPVVEEDGAGILDHLELGANDGKASLDEPVLVRGALVLLLPCACNVVVRRKRILLQHLRVLLDDRHVRLKLGQAIVAELVGAGQVRVCDRVRSLQVGVEGCDPAAVCVGGKVQRACANVGVLDCLDRVVHYGVRVEVLIGALVLSLFRFVCKVCV